MLLGLSSGVLQRQKPRPAVLPGVAGRLAASSAAGQLGATPISDADCAAGNSLLPIRPSELASLVAWVCWLHHSSSSVHKHSTECETRSKT